MNDGTGQGLKTDWLMNEYMLINQSHNIFFSRIIKCLERFHAHIKSVFKLYHIRLIHIRVERDHKCDKTLLHNIVIFLGLKLKTSG